MEKTEEHSNLTYPKQLLEFAETLKDNEALDFDKEHDKMIVIFDADIFEEKVQGYEELIKKGEKSNIIGITNPSFEVFLLLHVEGASFDVRDVLCLVKIDLLTLLHLN